VWLAGFVTPVNTRSPLTFQPARRRTEDHKPSAGPLTRFKNKHLSTLVSDLGRNVGSTMNMRS
jgi:hypothetical protein